MKKLTVLIVLFTILVSCSSNDEISPKSYEGKYQLIEMSGSALNSKTTGSEMDWQEFYLLNTDSTFIKSREVDETLTEVNGTYNLIGSLNERRLVFIYQTGNEIIGTCSPDILKEEMLFQSENIFFSTWHQCDGPGLKYEKL